MLITECGRLVLAAHAISADLHVLRLMQRDYRRRAELEDYLKVLSLIAAPASCAIVIK
jgi:hypothetical protein